MTIFPYLFSWVDIWWYVHDQLSSYRVVARFYDVFCHLMVRIHTVSTFHVVGSMWYHLVGTIHTCSILNPVNLWSGQHRPCHRSNPTK